MPQFDFSQALPQIIWLVLVFGILYLAVRGLYPRVEKVVENRKARIAADLREAEAARDSAEAATSGGTTALAQARAHALGVTGKARDEANAATQRRLAEIDAGLEAKAEAAAASLVRQRDTAVAELDAVAAEAAADLVKRVAGLDVSNDEAAEAVKKAAA
ncbi:ATPase [Sandaracinobacter sp. RS1-74]|uniref:F0F1 ATP synthase subunit B family protein n=1 Tax=Sandaracinobacteroides sayramensis TaxID=2913411 RepID=UPI001EDB4850|nr:ATPase [Sandaracinobacteroides sayramensis]MCG2840277.1 ATPase [Sandaracinobacteroides sayramensis]